MQRVDPTAFPGEDRGSGPVEFVLVGALLTVLTLGVLQLALVIYVRNVVHDAAVEGAFHAALADTAISEGVDRTEQIIERTVGGQFAEIVVAERVHSIGQPSVKVTVRGTFPLLGLLGAPRGLEVSAYAPMERFD